MIKYLFSFFLVFFFVIEFGAFNPLIGLSLDLTVSYNNCCYLMVKRIHLKPLPTTRTINFTCLQLKLDWVLLHHWHWFIKKSSILFYLFYFVLILFHFFWFRSFFFNSLFKRFSSFFSLFILSFFGLFFSSILKLPKFLYSINLFNFFGYFNSFLFFFFFFQFSSICFDRFSF